jgi:hypothetical protein
MNEHEMKVHEMNLEENRQLALRKARYRMLAHQWHMKRRYRLRGRITQDQWMDWANMYLLSLDDSPWRRWCEWQMSRPTRTQGW